MWPTWDRSPATTSDYYDGDDELTMSVDAAGHTTSYAYDADGNVTLEISGYSTTQANLADTTSFAYDKDNNNTLMITGYGSSNPECQWALQNQPLMGASKPARG